ncbi:MAG: DUF421 domain-containing protein [Chloroflexota bacterium]|nr:DUF421 domain-containing protein [Chloroflexota bacterium]
MNRQTFFEDWSGLGRVIVVGILAYVTLVLVLRLSGKRTLSKMNAFDLVVTVALGSTLATIILSKDVALVEGISALGLLVGLQYVVTWSSVRSKAIGRLMKSDPTLLFYQGRFLHEQLRHSRVVEEEVLAAVRQQGIASLDDVDAVVLETDGTMAVVTPGSGGRSSLAPVTGIAEQ